MHYMYMYDSEVKLEVECELHGIVVEVSSAALRFQKAFLRILLRYVRPSKRRIRIFSCTMHKQSGDK